MSGSEQDDGGSAPTPSTAVHRGARAITVRVSFYNERARVVRNRPRILRGGLIGALMTGGLATAAYAATGFLWVLKPREREGLQQITAQA
jgi:hypothetical protein